MHDKYDIIEFSKIYKRVMDIELRLKESLKFALTATYPDKMFYRLIPFLTQNFLGRYVKGYGKKKRDLILNLIKSKKFEEEKMNEFIDMSYLSDILQLLTDYPTIYKDMKFTRNFYREKLIFNDLKRAAALLTKLRNNIMHFNLSSYKANKRNYLWALGFWEKQLNCSICFIHSLPQTEPKIIHILKLLISCNQDILTMSDRIVCDIFDDVAFLNGLEVKKLPEYWSIVRCFYELKRKIIKK